MKKILAMILAMLMLLSMSVALADADDTKDDATVTITKQYKAVNGGVSPAETFSFSAFTPVPFSDDQPVGENPAAEFPAQLPTIGSITYAEGDATADGTGTGTKTATITLPTYTAVGVYTYSFTEVTPQTKTAGVTYNDETLYLVVTVLEQNGKIRVAAVHCEGSHDKGTYGVTPKTDIFENKYESGTLAVTKTVTGNMGDKTKYFDVTVTFTAASGEALNSTITYTGGKYTTAETVSNNTATIQVKDGDTVTFSNVPEGVTWKVEEADYTGEGYDAATYSTQTAGMTAGGAATCTITNNKTTTPDTGITLETLPYVLVLGIALFGVALMIIRRRRNED